MPKHRATADQVFHALGDANRRAIVKKLSAGSSSASQFAEPLGITLAAVVQHLQVLERSGLVRTAKAGRVRTCELAPAGFSVAEQWMQTCRSMWEGRLDRLAEVLAED